MKSLFLLLLIFSGLFTSAQFAAIPRRSIVFEPVQYYSTTDGGFIQLKKIPKSTPGRGWKFYYLLSIVKYDKDMKFLNEHKLFENDKDLKPFHALLIKSGNVYQLIYAEAADGSKIGDIMAVEIDPLSFKTGTPKVLADKNVMGIHVPLFSVLGSQKIVFESSPNAKRHSLLVGSGKGDFYLSCFDENLNALWGGKYNIPKVEQKYIRNVVVDDIGNLLITSADNRLAYITMYSQGNAPFHKQMELPDVQPADIALFIDKLTNEIFAGGIYRNGGENVTGVFSALLDKTNLTLGKVQRSDFPDSLVKKLKKDNFASTKPKNYGLFPFNLSCRLLGRQNAGVQLIMECRQDLLGSSGLSVATAAGSILIINFNAGEAIYTHIPRYAVTGSSKGDDRYYAMACKDRLLVFYIDAEANLQKSLSEPQTILKDEMNGILTVAQIENSGNVIREAVPENNSMDLWGRAKLYSLRKCSGL